MNGWLQLKKKEEGPARKKSRGEEDLEELKMMFGSIMKRLQMATERISEMECEMKTLKEWKVDQQPQIKVFEMNKTKQHMPITIMET